MAPHPQGERSRDGKTRPASKSRRHNPCKTQETSHQGYSGPYDWRHVPTNHQIADRVRGRIDGKLLPNPQTPNPHHSCDGLEVLQKLEITEREHASE